VSKPVKLAALGSSFAAGPGIEPVENVDAMRSSRNYAHQLAERLSADLVDLTVSGATTATVLETPQITMAGVEFAPQIDGLPEDADLVMVTAGGNDLQYAGSMLYAAWSRLQPDSPILAMLGQGQTDGIPEPTGRDVEAVALGLTKIVTAARSRAEHARLVLVDYLTVVESSSGGAVWPFSSEETAAFGRIQDALIRGYEIAAERTGADLLKASELSTGHGLGAQEPWVFGFESSLERIGASFHPNETGMSAIADALAARFT
jgi:lysophospholipase L1-like esterase